MPSPVTAWWRTRSRFWAGRAITAPRTSHAGGWTTVNHSATAKTATRTTKSPVSSHRARERDVRRRASSLALPVVGARRRCVGADILAGHDPFLPAALVDHAGAGFVGAAKGRDEQGESHGSAESADRRLERDADGGDR